MDLKEHFIHQEPFYLPVADEIQHFCAAYESRVPILLKGPTGCGKTRFVEHLAWKLQKPLITISCHEDMTASDLTGRFLLKDDSTEWHDGPLTLAAKFGAICYLDEIVEARQDTTVVIHQLTDHRRTLSLEKTNEVIEAHKDFLLIMSYNPGLQHSQKELKASTKQRFCALNFDYPNFKAEVKILERHSRVDLIVAEQIVRLGQSTRRIQDYKLLHGASTRMLIHAGKLISNGLSFSDACRLAIVEPITEDEETKSALMACIAALE